MERIAFWWGTGVLAFSLLVCESVCTMVYNAIPLRNIIATRIAGLESDYCSVRVASTHRRHSGKELPSGTVADASPDTRKTIEFTVRRIAFELNTSDEAA